MSDGVKALLEAAQYIEQQEKLKLSPQAAATALPAILNEQQQRFIVHAAYDPTSASASSSTTTTTATSTLTNGHVNNSNNNNNINGINIRNSNIRHGSNNANVNGTTILHQVSSSAPAAAATFQHVNGHHQHQHNNSTSTLLHHHHHQNHHTPTTVLTNGVTLTNGHHNHHHSHQQQQQQQQQNSQLLNANHNDYEFNGNNNANASSNAGGGSVTIITANVATASPNSSSSSSSLNGRSSEGGRIITDDASDNNNSNNKDKNNVGINSAPKTSFMLLAKSATTCSSPRPAPAMSPPIPMVTDEEQVVPAVKIVGKTQSEIVPMDTTVTTTSGGAATTFTLIASNGDILGNAAASKQILLANGIRIAVPPTTTTASTAIMGQLPQQVALSKAINIPPFNNKSVPIITGFPYYSQLPASLPSSMSQQTTLPPQQQHRAVNGNVVGAGGSKTFIPLTPPPIASRKFVESTQSRIRSFSLSSHKISANNHHHQLHVQNHNNNNSMMVDDIPPTHSFGTNSSSTTPPRHISSSLGATAGTMTNGWQMLNTASGGGSMQQTTIGGAASSSGSNHVTHATPRRRTISSTSNGAGTREVHNKLEKNRRAHLKECYEHLKNELPVKKDEDRRKTSNLAILGEAHKLVESLKIKNQELEAEGERLANDKINLQKRIVSLKRELGPKYEQLFSNMFPDNELGSIPNERENVNDTHSLASGRGSALYSSSSSLSSGGSSSSNGGSASNTMSSPVGAGLQTAMPTTISPVINKINHNVNTTSPISISNNNNLVIQQQHKNPINNTTIQAVAMPVSPHQIGSSAGGGICSSSASAGSPTAIVTFSGSSLPLSLTAKNISATAVTRGSPTPSTPSPSPSSSSGVSSSSSLISSSPPINGVISNGRNVTVNITNGLKLHAAAGGANPNTTSATILATSAPAQGVSNTSNAILVGNQQQYNHNGRKKSLTLSATSNNNNNHNNNTTNNINHMVENRHQQPQQQTTTEDGEQPAKFLKVFNNTSAASATNCQKHELKTTHGQKFILTGNGGGGILTNCGVGVSVGGGLGGNGNINSNGGSTTVSSSSSVTLINKALCNNNNNNNNYSTSSSSSLSTTTTTLAAATTTNELCRLPGGAELNILPTNGLKLNSSNGLSTGSLATTFYHANGKITFVNGPPPPSLTNSHQQYQQQNHGQHHHPPSSSSLPNSTTITSNGTTTLTTNGILLKDATSVGAGGVVTPLLVSTATSVGTTSAGGVNSVNGLHFTGNFAQLIAAANTNSNNNNSINNNNNSSSIGTGKTTSVTASVLPMATNFQNMAEQKIKTNSKSSIVTWRSGAATTN